ncbi:hypothetical protein H6P81_003651 [Aristolochia fimbriata]|uniref:Uncharacterized protein n=1 Tax=Aristolochia fimbriata TaxID=158543 RepID=A0AAV7FDF1_ARIFI|nr:hypothetical protein H6P81_003651 [Aristolochia fimbriata]
MVKVKNTNDRRKYVRVAPCSDFCSSRAVPQSPGHLLQIKSRTTCIRLQMTPHRHMCLIIVSQTFLSLTQGIGTAWKTFMLFGLVAFVGIYFVFLFIPKTKRVSIEGIKRWLREEEVYMNCGSGRKITWNLYTIHALTTFTQLDHGNLYTSHAKRC